MSDGWTVEQWRSQEWNPDTGEPESASTNVEAPPTEPEPDGEISLAEDTPHATDAPPEPPNLTARVLGRLQTQAAETEREAEAEREAERSAEVAQLEDDPLRALAQAQAARKRRMPGHRRPHLGR